MEDKSNVIRIPSLFPSAANNSRAPSFQRSNKRLHVEETKKPTLVMVVPADNKNKKRVLAEVTPNVRVQTNMTPFQIPNRIDAQQSTVQFQNQKRILEKKNDELIEQRKKIDELLLKKSSFLDKNDKLKYYTGLPDLKTFQAILDAAGPELNCIRALKLDDFQKLLMCFMKLRLNLHYQDLAYRFDIPSQTVSFVFQKVMILLKHNIQYLIKWPDQEYLKSSMPQCFVSKFGNSVAVIVDCFEISADTSKIKIRSQTCSNFAQKCITKYLIGVTPCGAVSFISKGFDGFANDTEIVEKSGFLDNITPGNIVLANRGFHLEGLGEAIKMKGAELKTLDSSTGEDSNGMANVRNHVVKLMGDVKHKYILLNGPVSFTLMNTSFENVRILDGAVHVACMLSNLCDSLVSDLTCV